MALQILPNSLFRRGDLALVQKRRGHRHGRRELRQAGSTTCGFLCFGELAPGSVQGLEGCPTLGQGVVRIHGAAIGTKGFRLVPE